MSSVLFLIDDKSPLIHYDSNWVLGTSSDDTQADQYFRATFQWSNVTGSVVTFSFNGTAFWIYGAKRKYYGTYTVTVDDASFAGYTAESSTNVFRQVLFNQSGLTQTLHNVSFTFTGTASFIDIDMVVWQTEFNETQLVTEIVDDADPRFQYQEPAQWNTNPTYVNLFNNGTGHSTSFSNASVTLTFSGMSPNSVSIYGTVGLNNGLYSVSLDSQQATQYNASYPSLTFYEVILYHADNLGSGQHQLTITNLPETNGQTSLDIDYALLTSSSTTSSLSGSPVGSSTPSDPSRGLGSGAIAGIVVAVGIALLTSAAAFFFYRRWKLAQAASQDLYGIRTPQRPPENADMGAFSSVETRNDASLIRQDALSQGTSQGTSSPFDELGNSRRPLPEAPGTRQNIFQLPVPDDSMGIPKSTSLQRRAPAQSGSATIGDIPPPPDYLQATR